MIIDSEGKPNRIAQNIAKKELDIEKRIADGITTVEKVEIARQGLDMSFDEYVRFQDLKSLAVQSELITLEEGQTIYHYLGTVPAVFNGQSAAVKAVLTFFFKELLERQL